jgi:hypothetical protein
MSRKPGRYTGQEALDAFVLVLMAVILVAAGWALARIW